MKKLLSLFLALLLLVSLTGCGALSDISTLPPSAEITESPDIVPQILVPNLIGKSIHNLKASENYTVIQSESELSDQPAGTILRQEPETGSFVDVGVTISVVVSAGDGTGATEPTLPPQTDPPEGLPTTRPYLPEQTDPDYPGQDEQPTEPNRPTNPPATQPPATQPPATQPQPTLDRNGSYTTKDDVALYLHLYGRLPNNFITKRQAENQYGWDGGSLSRYGLCIGGDRFYNNEGRLPSGYTYYECDIGTLYSSSRGAKRLVFTYSGIIYYTSDHYKTFTRLY